MIDGVKRKPAVEARINNAFLATFRGKSAEFVMQYLRSITINAVQGPETPAEALRHREGMRDLVRIIQSRIEAGEADAKRELLAKE